MRSWIEQRQNGSVLVRSGEGLVTAVSPIDSSQVDVDSAGGTQYVLIELQCLTDRRPRSIRVTLRAVAPEAIEIVERARALEGTAESATWLVEWHRRSGIPAELPIEHLHLPTDATPFLMALSPMADPHTEATAVSHRPV